MKKFHLLFLISLISLVGWSWPSFLYTSPNQEKFGSNVWINKEVQIIQSQASNLNSSVLKLSLQAYVNARKKGLDSKQLLTIIDYSKPSNRRRLWVFDLKQNKVLFNTWVSHGKNSGGVNATSFSNQNGSLKSSIGVFLTDNQSYVGSHGQALRIKGLEHGINDNAYNRNVVFHGAWYVNSDTIKKYGAVGRSWGCPAVSDQLIKPLVNTIKDHTLVFVYYPDQNWIRHSNFLA